MNGFQQLISTANLHLFNQRCVEHPWQESLRLRLTLRRCITIYDEKRRTNCIVWINDSLFVIEVGARCAGKLWRNSWRKHNCVGFWCDNTHRMIPRRWLHQIGSILTLFVRLSDNDSIHQYHSQHSSFIRILDVIICFWGCCWELWDDFDERLTGRTSRYIYPPPKPIEIVFCTWWG